jgi:hypothetical protein
MTSKVIMSPGKSPQMSINEESGKSRRSLYSIDVSSLRKAILIIVPVLCG